MPRTFRQIFKTVASEYRNHRVRSVIGEINFVLQIGRVFHADLIPDIVGVHITLSGHPLQVVNRHFDPTCTAVLSEGHRPVEEKGPLVVFQHGLLSNEENWKVYGFVVALTDKYRVARVDSLGHGLSDKPPDPRLYDQKQRSGDIVAVIDDLGADRAHLVGYSMGGWMSVGVAKYHPHRLSSLVVGGWDLVNGVATAMPQGSAGPFTFDMLLKGAKASAPELVEWVTPDVVPGLSA